CEFLMQRRCPTSKPASTASQHSSQEQSKQLKYPNGVARPESAKGVVKLAPATPFAEPQSVPPMRDFLIAKQPIFHRTNLPSAAYKPTPSVGLSLDGQFVLGWPPRGVPRSKIGCRSRLSTGT